MAHMVHSTRRATSRPATVKSTAVPDVDSVVAALKKMGTKKTRDGMARYAIPSDKAFGIPVGDLQKFAKTLGKSHDLAQGLWATGWYEARMLAAFVGEADKVTPVHMDEWCQDFDSWAICDTVCFHLFDRTPHALGKIKRWAAHKGEFQKRGAFALLACVALHNKTVGDEPFAECLPLIERAADDERNFVKKGASWALRAVGLRSAALRPAAIELAKKLAASSDMTARWIGKDALGPLSKPARKRS